MTIQELYHDERFKEIVYYLNECGFSSLEDLCTFNFEELFFVPGATSETVEEAEALFRCAEESSLPEAEKHIKAAEQNELIAKEQNPEINNNRDEILRKNICDCINELYIAVKALNRQQLSALKEGAPEIDTARGVCLETFLGICDDLEPLLQETPDAAAPLPKYSDEEKELLIHAELDPVFANISRGSAMIRFCSENGKRSLWDLIDFDFSGTKIKGLGPDSMEGCKKAFLRAVKNTLTPVPEITEEEETPAVQFREAYECLKGNEQSALLSKAQGETLQGIGDRFGLTRERVRQIIAKAVRKLSSAAQLVVNQLAGSSTGFYKNAIKTVFADQELMDCFAYVLENSEIVKYIEFADKYVISAAIQNDYADRLAIITNELVGDSVNLFNILEEVEDALQNNGLEFMDACDFMGYLFSKRYIAMGDYFMKKKGTYQQVCHDVIARHFKSGIKLDSDENNTDMQLMRDYVFMEYSGYTLPDNNRAITARISPTLILCGRGKYCAPETAVFDEALFEQIVEYINNAKESSLYYSEIFAAFSGRLLAETSIDNANYLHGALKYLYPNDFEYERDMLVKHGEIRVSFVDRLANAILNKGKPMTKKEISQLFPGVADIRIVNAVIAEKKLIQWDYNKFNHIDNIVCSEDDLTALRAVLERELNALHGYCSENKFFEAVKKAYPDFIKKNNITAGLNLFYIAANKFENEFRFSRPHIASVEFPDMELTNVNVARYFIANKSELMYPEIVAFSQTAGWSNGTFTMVLNAIEEDYVKVDLNRYIRKSLFSVEPSAIKDVQQKLLDLTSSAGYFGIFAIFDYKGFPNVGYEWNEFLLQTIIESYDTGYRLLEPTIKDRRYLRGIIVPQGADCDSYEDFIILQMKKDGLSSIEKESFSGYLRRKGLVLTATIPIELYEGDGLRLEGNRFVFG